MREVFHLERFSSRLLTLQALDSDVLSTNRYSPVHTKVAVVWVGIRVYQDVIPSAKYEKKTLRQGDRATKLVFWQSEKDSAGWTLIGALSIQYSTE